MLLPSCSFISLKHRHLGLFLTRMCHFCSNLLLGSSLCSPRILECVASKGCVVHLYFFKSYFQHFSQQTTSFLHIPALQLELRVSRCIRTWHRQQGQPGRSDSVWWNVVRVTGTPCWEAWQDPLWRFEGIWRFWRPHDAGLCSDVPRNLIVLPWGWFVAWMLMHSPSWLAKQSRSVIFKCYD